MEAIVPYGVACLADPVKALYTASFGHVVSCRDNIDSLRQEVRELQSRMEDMTKDIAGAEREGKSPRSGAKLWLQRVKEVQDQAEKTEASFSKLYRCLGCCNPNVLSRYRIGKKAAKLVTDARELKDRKFEEIASKADPCRFVERPVGSMVGRASELQRLQELSADDSVSIIGIHGMGGVGKTILLKNLFNQFHLKDDYHMIWVNMNSCHTVEDAQKAIAQVLGLVWSENDDEEARARRIFSYLRNKAFILILDHVWKPLDLHHVGIPSGTRQRTKSKIILATRIEDVCDSMDASKVHLKCLEWEDAWSLFMDKAGKKLVESRPTIRRHAEALVKKCGGLPLALVTVGRTMANKKTPQSWKHAITQMDIAPHEILGEVVSSLKMSYDNLANDALRTCLLYCLLFPENTSIYKEWIIDYGIGEGVIDDNFYDADEIYDEGHDAIDILKSASLLESLGGDDLDYVKMHPVIRILAFWIACDCGVEEKRWLVRTKHGLKVAPEGVKWRGAERISLADNSIAVLPEVPECPCLLTLLLHHNRDLRKINDGFLRSMRNLRVLDVSHTSVQEIPVEIGELVELRYLDFYGTKITSLPQEMGNLVKLRFLLLSNTASLKKVPRGLIGKLSELRVLRMYHSFDDWKVGAGSGGEGADFEELCRLERLNTLGISVNTLLTLQKLAGSFRLAKSTRYLEINLSPGLKTLSTANLGNDFRSLKDVRLADCSDLEEMEIDGGDTDWSNLPSLMELYLVRLPKVRITWKSGCLENLVYLQIGRCGGMRHLIHSDDELVKKQKGEEIDVLPKLIQLDLYDMLELESLSCGGKPLAFPCLDSLDIENCPVLKRLPFNAEKLSCIKGGKSWWNSLDDDTRSKFQPVFKEEYP